MVVDEDQGGCGELKRPPDHLPRIDGRMVDGPIGHQLVAEQDVAAIKIKRPELLARQMGERGPRIGQQGRPGRQDRPGAGGAARQPDGDLAQELQVQQSAGPQTVHPTQLGNIGGEDVAQPAEPFEQVGGEPVAVRAAPAAAEQEGKQGSVVQIAQAGRFRTGCRPRRHRGRG